MVEEPSEDHRMSERRYERWMLDKKIPLAMMLTILVQTGGAVWWAATLDGRISNLEKQMTEASSTKVVERLVRLEVLMEHAARTLTNMDQRLEARARERNR